MFSDRSFDFITKTPPASVLLKQAAGLAKGSGEPNRNKVGTVTKDQVRKIAETKMPDLNAVDIDAAMRMVAGTARSMGIARGGIGEYEAKASVYAAATAKVDHDEVLRPR